MNQQDGERWLDHLWEFCQLPDITKGIAGEGLISLALSGVEAGRPVLTIEITRGSGADGAKSIDLTRAKVKRIAYALLSAAEMMEYS